jgi:ribosome maturation factor RimP
VRIRESGQATLFCQANVTMVKETISHIISETARSLGYMIYDYAIYLKGENTRINVKIDSLAGISHADCEAFSRELSQGLEAGEILPNFFLEVSSPGIRRRVRSRDEFMRFTGAPVKIVSRTDAGSRVVKGRIGGVTETGVMIESEKGETAVPFETIDRANLDY